MKNKQEVEKPRVRKTIDCTDCPIFDLCMYDLTGICINERKQAEMKEFLNEMETDNE